MIKTVKVRLRPTTSQETKLWQSAGVSRFAYNWAVAYQIENYKNGGKFIYDCELRRKFTEVKRQPEYLWLYETSNNIPKQAIKDACNAYLRFFQKKAGKPKFKSKRRSKPSFFNDPVKLKYKDGKFLIEKVGWVRISEKERIIASKFYNPHIKHDGKYWYINVGIDFEKPKSELTGETVGIDIGIKDLAVCSNGMQFKNISKEKNAKTQAKKLCRLKRQVWRKYQKNKEGGKLAKTANIFKLEKKIKLINRKIANIRIDHIHQATTSIVKTKPSRVLIASLNVQKMMKNRYLAKAIRAQGLYKFKITMKYKCKFHGIEFVESDKLQAHSE